MFGKLRLAWLFLMLCLASGSVSAGDGHRVLLLNSYHPQYKWTQEITRGVQHALAGRVAAENLYVEFMDERRFLDDKIYETRLIALLEHKYRQYEPDIIITSDDHAYYFMVEHGEALFPGKPIVFCGVNVFYPASMRGRSNITGIQEGMEIEGNIELIQRIQPGISRVILLGDTTGLGLRMTREARKLQARWRESGTDSNKPSLEIWDSFSLEELYQRVAGLEDDTALLMLAIHKDRLGQYFSFDTQLPLLSKASKVPVYGMWGALMIGRGVIGGLMNDPFEHGQSAANMALQILAGTEITQLPVRDKARFGPQFDYLQLQRFGIDLGLLPEDSVITDRPVSLYEEYADVIVATCLLLLFLMLVISILAHNIRRRIGTQAELDRLNRSLEAEVAQRTADLHQRNNQLQTLSEQMAGLASTDTLTGLPNRRAGVDEVGAYFRRAAQDRRPFSTAMLDIDFFKQLNDTYGHKAGDDVLIAFAEVLKTCLRPGDRVYRWGGEEFLVILPGAEIAAAEEVCQRLCQLIAAHDFGIVGGLSASIGVTELRPGDNLDTMLQRADIALYQAKQGGRNRACSG
jgi:diguanylate cyclase (GGDEF)-like protein